MSIDLPLSGVLDEIQTLVLDRHQKYGPLNISSAPGGPLNGLRVRLYDKLARINHALDSGGQVDFDDDSFRDAFLDVVGYGLIGLLVLDGEWPGETEKPLAEYLEPATKLRTVPAEPGQTWRWSNLHHPKKPNRGPDGWPIGSTFNPDDGWLLWTRAPGGWTNESQTFAAANLRAVVDHFAYSDGIITTPAPEEEAA